MKTWADEFLGESEGNRIAVEKEVLALKVAEEISCALNNQQMNRADFARKVGKSKGYVTRLLQGNYNLTLGTIAEIGYQLGCSVEVVFRPLTIRRQFAFTGPPASQLGQDDTSELAA